MRLITFSLCFVFSNLLNSQNSTSSGYYDRIKKDDTLSINSRALKTRDQQYEEYIEKIIHLDNDIYQWDWFGKPSHIDTPQYVYAFVDTRRKITDITAKLKINFNSEDKLYPRDLSWYKRKRMLPSGTLATFVKDSLVPLLNITSDSYNTSNFKGCLDRINHVETITWLEYVFRDVVRKSEFNPNDIQHDANQLKEMLQLINIRMDEIMNNMISMYRFTETSKKYIRGVSIEHSNDFLSVFKKYNDDRDMTGSFRLEIPTDQFKMRILDGYAINKFSLNLNTRNFYSYQSVFIGGEGYTPYLRDTSIFKTSLSVDSLDRPYASFQYFGRAKYRVSRHGRFRMFNQIKLGTIGARRPYLIQAFIHRDVTMGSFSPNGWDAQIAAGGRLGFSFEYYPEFMITSVRKLKLINVSAFGELKYGSDMTAAGVGLKISNKNFLKTGGNNFPFIDRASTNFREFLNNDVVFSGLLMYRRVIHNSMLEGYGVLKHRIDENANSPVDIYYLKPNQVERNVLISELSLNIKFNNCGIVFKQTIMSPEYDLPVNSKHYENGKKGVSSNHNTSSWNHYGTIGVFFLLK